ncbi:MAG: glycosyltransferase family 9 protein [Ignavibacteriaceae bacterium]|nr:glycosyltransferase family 9 protein [Ignavibacteriaceae bacterium]
MIIDFSEISKILIIRLSSLGDVLLTTPLIRNIKKKNPAIQIDFVVRDKFFEAVQNNSNLNKIYKYVNSKSEKESLFTSLSSKKYDLVIDLQNNLRSKEILRQVHSKVLHFNKSNFKKFLLVHLKINLLKDASQIPLRYAEAAGIDKLDNEGLDFYTENLTNTLLKKDVKYIGLCPGAKHFTKRWPKEYFIDLGKKLETAGFKIVLFGGAEEIQICNDIESALSNAINLSNTSLLQVGADMKLCDAIYTNDSGLMHLASAVGIPVLTFFGSTVKEFGFFPYNAKSIVLENENLSCRPCTHIGRKSCPKIHFKCMLEIKSELAYSSLTKLAG